MKASKRHYVLITITILVLVIFLLLAQYRLEGLLR